MDFIPSDWHYGAYVDVGYVGNFNSPDNHLWRSRATAAHHNELSPNMGLAYVRKDVSTSSRWGMELGFQGAGLRRVRILGGRTTRRWVGSAPARPSRQRLVSCTGRQRADDHHRLVQQSGGVRIALRERQRQLYAVMDRRQQPLHDVGCERSVSSERAVHGLGFHCE